MVENRRETKRYLLRSASAKVTAELAHKKYQQMEINEESYWKIKRNHKQIGSQHRF